MLYNNILPQIGFVNNNFKNFQNNLSEYVKRLIDVFKNDDVSCDFVTNYKNSKVYNADIYADACEFVQGLPNSDALAVALAARCAQILHNSSQYLKEAGVSLTNKYSVDDVYKRHIMRGVAKVVMSYAVQGKYKDKPSYYPLGWSELLSDDLILTIAFDYYYFIKTGVGASGQTVKSIGSPSSIYAEVVDTLNDLLLSFSLSFTFMSTFSDIYTFPYTDDMFQKAFCELSKVEAGIIPQAEIQAYLYKAITEDNQNFLMPEYDLPFFVRAVFAGELPTLPLDIVVKTGLCLFRRANRSDTSDYVAVNLDVDHPTLVKFDKPKDEAVNYALANYCGIIGFFTDKSNYDSKTLVFESDTGYHYPLSPEALRGKLGHMFPRSTDGWRRSKYVDLLEAVKPIDVLCLADERGIIACDNGKQIYRVTRDGRLEDVTEEYKRKYYCISPVQTRYNPDAKSDAVDEYLRVLSYDFANDRDDHNMLKLIEEMMGCAITSDFEASKQVFVLVSDILDRAKDAGTGKSTFLDFLTEVIGFSRVSAVKLSNFGNGFELSDLRYKLLNTDRDVSSRQLSRNETSWLKTVTGGDMLRLGDKYERGKNTRVYCTQIFASNTMLRVASDDAQNDGLQRRMHHVAFRCDFLHDQRLSGMSKEKITSDPEWRERMLWHAVEGLKRLIANGWQFSEPQYSLRLEYRFLAENNPCIGALVSSNEMKFDHFIGKAPSRYIKRKREWAVKPENAHKEEAMQVLDMTKEDNTSRRTDFWYEFWFKDMCKSAGIDCKDISQQKFSDNMRKISGLQSKPDGHGNKVFTDARSKYGFKTDTSERWFLGDHMSEDVPIDEALTPHKVGGSYGELFGEFAVLGDETLFYPFETYKSERLVDESKEAIAFEGAKSSDFPVTGTLDFVAKKTEELYKEKHGEVAYSNSSEEDIAKEEIELIGDWFDGATPEDRQEFANKADELHQAYARYLDNLSDRLDGVGLPDVYAVEWSSSFMCFFDAIPDPVTGFNLRDQQLKFRADKQSDNRNKYLACLWRAVYKRYKTLSSIIEMMKSRGVEAEEQIETEQLAETNLKEML